MEDPLIYILAPIKWAINSSYCSIKEATPGKMVFKRDMIFHYTFKANNQAIHMSKAKDILLHIAKANRTRSNHKYKVGNYAYNNKGTLSRKLMAPHDCTYRINEMNQATNDTVQVQRGAVEETINIKRLIPYSGQPYSLHCPVLGGKC